MLDFTSIHNGQATLALLSHGDRNVKQCPPAPSPSRRLRSTSSSRLPDFLSTLPLEPPSVVKNQRTGRSSLLKFRSNSLTRLFSNNVSDKTQNWAHDSNSTDATFNSSFASFVEEDNWAARALLKDFDKTIQEQTGLKEQTQQHIASMQALAWARYTSGNQIGALISMRKVHKYLSRAAHLATAITKLEEVRNRLHRDITHGSFDPTDLMDKRRAMILNLVQLKQTESLSSSKVASDELLLEQLYNVMGMAEI